MSTNMNEENFDEKLEAPILFSIKKKELKSPPDGYFDEFSDRVMKRIHANDQAKGNVISIHNKPFRYAVAACTILMIGFGLSIYLFQEKAAVPSGDMVLSTEEMYLEEIGEEHLINYVEEESKTSTNKTDDYSDYQSYINEEIILEEL